MAVITHQRAAFSNPGRMPEGMQAPFHSEHMKIVNCERCIGKETWKPVRAHHCAACGFCVFKVSKKKSFSNPHINHQSFFFYRWTIIVPGSTIALDIRTWNTSCNLLFTSDSLLHTCRFLCLFLSTSSCRTRNLKFIWTNPGTPMLLSHQLSLLSKVYCLLFSLMNLLESNLNPLRITSLMLTILKSNMACSKNYLKMLRLLLDKTSCGGSCLLIPS